MTTRARRSRAAEVKPSDGIAVEGAERYIWVFPEGDQLVLAIPGLRGLKFSAEEAQAVGEMLIQAAAEMTDCQKRQVEGGGSYGSTEEPPTEG
jgi:hypothetical protein